MQKFLDQKLHKNYFVLKREIANPIFDAYCCQTCMDNVFRGGFPIQLEQDKMFYIYSRKCGNLEWEYNYFCMEAEYYSQGNGNYRDINQNRRCDVFFTPYVKDFNIRMFYN